MDGTIILQGSFVSDGNAKYIPIRSDVDWMRVVNYTNSIGVVNASGTSFYWQRGMATGRGLVHPHIGGDATIGVAEIAANNGFTLYDTSVNTPGAQIVTTGTTSVPAPVVSTAHTAGLVAFQSIVRLDSIAAAPTLCGIDFSPVAIVAGVRFTLPTLASTVALGGAGHYRVIPYNPLFYPRNRTVCNVTRAANAVVTTTIPHGLTVGQQVRFSVPVYSGLGMVELDNVLATVLTVDAPNNLSFTIDINTTAYTAFAWPLAGSAPCQFPQMVPVGIAAQHPYENILTDATRNTGAIGMILGAGNDAATRLLAPAGTNNDVIYWVAGKSWNM